VVIKPDKQDTTTFRTESREPTRDSLHQHLLSDNFSNIHGTFLPNPSTSEKTIEFLQQQQLLLQSKVNNFNIQGNFSYNPESRERTIIELSQQEQILQSKVNNINTQRNCFSYIPEARKITIIELSQQEQMLQSKVNKINTQGIFFYSPETRERNIIGLSQQEQLLQSKVDNIHRQENLFSGSSKTGEVTLELLREQLQPVNTVNIQDKCFTCSTKPTREASVQLLQENENARLSSISCQTDLTGEVVSQNTVELQEKKPMKDSCCQTELTGEIISDMCYVVF